MSNGTITLTNEQLEDLIGLVRKAAGMMEPYYSQCGAGDEIESELEPFEDLLPYIETVYRPVIVTCPLCAKKFRHAQGAGDHMRNQHGWSRKKVSTEIIEASAPFNRTWESRAAYKAALNEVTV
jgi:hypothetical protein